MKGCCVSRREPSWWYGTSSWPWPRVLAPVSAIYGRVAAARLGSPPRYRSRLPVICIGNFTAGGTGKTPLTLEVSRMLRECGERPVVLSRGYGGRINGPHAVDLARDTAADVGDEPLLMARSLPVFIARDRVAGAQAAEADPRGFSVILMDDGLQNPSLHKDLTIAVVDGRRGFGNGRVIPAGPLRAPLAVQLPQAGLIVVNGGVPADALHRVSESGFTGPILTTDVAPQDDLAGLMQQPIVAYAGIGAPERFFDLLTRHGTAIVERVAFGDHHAFTTADAERLLALAGLHSATLVTTEKDLARLAGATGALGALREASRPLPIMLAFSAADRATLLDHLQRAITTKRG